MVGAFVAEGAFPTQAEQMVNALTVKLHGLGLKIVEIDPVPADPPTQGLTS